MSERNNAYQRERAMAIARMAKAGSTSREIARTFHLDPKQIATLRRLGEMLLTLRAGKE